MDRTMAEAERCPVDNWQTDFDHTSPEYAASAPEIWQELRETCPVAHSERFGGTWLPTRHEDISRIAHDTEHFTSRGVIVSAFEPEIPAPVGYAPPITSDPPFHEIARRLLLPAFSPKAIRPLEASTRAYCSELLDTVLADQAALREKLATSGDPAVFDAAVFDAAEQYAQHIPVRVIARMLGVPAEDGDRFRGFIHRILELAGQSEEHLEPEDMMVFYILEQIEARRGESRDDLIGFLLEAEIDGVPLSDEHVLGTIALILLAGIDTTWSAIGASIWHLAQHPEQVARLIEQPELMPFAVEEFLRAFAPVTMARKVAKDIELGGKQLREGDWVLLPFPSANRDPEFFENPDEVILDREKNRHAAFGLGIHRCLGSNLARMELTVALEVWLEKIPNFTLEDPESVLWSTGQVRGPRKMPVRILTAQQDSLLKEQP
ncbi:MAG: cytochrome P450 [Microthrixaceae bacterium]